MNLVAIGMFLLLSSLSGQSVAQCSLPECQGLELKWKSTFGESAATRIGSLEFNIPKARKWPETSLQIVQSTTTTQDQFWLADNPPTVGINIPDPDKHLRIRAKTVVYKSVGEDGIVTQWSVGILGKPKRGVGVEFRLSWK